MATENAKAEEARVAAELIKEEKLKAEEAAQTEEERRAKRKRLAAEALRKEQLEAVRAKAVTRRKAEQAQRLAEEEARRRIEEIRQAKEEADQKAKQQASDNSEEASAVQEKPAVQLASATPPPSVRLDAGLKAYQSGDYDEALKHWQPAAEEGNANAQFYVGGLYRDGAGVTSSLPQAHFWWLLASENGHQTAKRFLGELRAEMLPHELVAADQLVKDWNQRIKDNSTE